MEITKECINCKAVKSIDEFYKRKTSKDGYRNDCKSCSLNRAKDIRRRYSELQETEIKDTKICCYCKTEKKIGEFNKDKSRKDGYSNKCKICAYDKHKTYREVNKEKLDLYQKEYYQNHKEEMKQYSKEYHKEYRIQNRERINKKQHEWRKMKLDTDPTFKLIKSLRRRTQLALNGNTKSEATKQLLGIATDIFTKWI